MRYIGSILICLAACALLCFGWPVLIQGPETVPVEAAARTIPQNAVMTCAETAADSSTLPALPEIQTARYGLPVGTVVTQAHMPTVVADRNGQPITSRVWWRTVYIACAPEGLPG